MTKKYFAYCLSLLVVFNVLLADVSSVVLATENNYLGTYDQSTNSCIENDFNLFILGNEKQSNVDSEERVAVGGNATYSNYALSSGLENNVASEGASTLINVSEDISPNNEPTVPNYSITTPEDIELSGMVVGTDKDGDSLTYTKATDPKNGKVEVNEDGTWTYTPNENYNGEDRFTVEVRDGKGGKAISTIEIVVTPENDEPYTPDYCVRTPEDTAVSGKVDGTDIDGDKLTYRKESDPENGKVEVNEDGTWTYTPNKDYFGKDKFTVEASDGNYEESVSTINITVTPVNDDPTVPDYSVSTPENTEVSGIVTGSDIEGDELTYTKDTDPNNGKVEVNKDGTWTYTPNKDYNGKDSFTVEVNDGNGGTAISTITIDVIPENVAPTVPDYSVTTPEDTAVSGIVTGTDIDGDSLTYIKATEPENGKVEVNENGIWTYTPNTDYNGKDSFTVEVSDGNGGKAISTITIDVTPVNDAPTVPDYSVTTPEDTPVSGIVIGTDKDGDSLTYRSITKPTNGTVVDDVYGKWTYTPNKDYNGKDSFTVEVSDGNGGTAISTITIEVTPVDDTKPSKPSTPSTPSKSKKEVTEPIVDIPAAAKVVADFAVLIDASTMRAGQNSTVKYTITYFNKLTTEVPNTFIKVNVPDKMTFIEADNNGKLVENEVVWDIGTLKGNAKDKMIFTLKANEIEEQEATVTLTSKIYSKYENIELINTNDDESKIDTFMFANESEFTHTRFILGYPDGTVKPKGPVTRAEVAVIFARVLKLKDQGHVKGVKVFSDVEVDFWGAEHIEAAAAVGLFKGYKDNTFKPNQPITRAELATVISNYLKITTYPEYSVLAQYFTDISGHWAEANITEIYRYGIIKGYEDNTFRPNNTITREETITMVNQMLHRGPLTKVKPSFPDNLESNWSFGHVEEATNTHKSFYNQDGSETLIKIIPEGIW